MLLLYIASEFKSSSKWAHESQHQKFKMTIPQDKYHQQLEASRNKVKMLINYYLNLVADSIILGEDPVLPIPTRSGYLEHQKNPEKFGTNQFTVFIFYNFIEIYLELMTEIYANLIKGQVKTKRDLFYGNSALYKKQTTIDSTIDNLAKVFSVSRDALNVVGSAKGLYFGEIVINNQLIDSRNVNLIPRREEIIDLNLGNTRFVLVIEKDAVLNIIVNNYNLLRKHLGSFLLVCGKGFPCLRTKQFLNLIEQNYPQMPKYILVDNDPYGIDIVLNYVAKTEVYQYL